MTALTVASILEQAVEAGALPGGSVVLAGPDGLREQHHAGVLAAGGTARVDERTMYRFASLTKSVVSVAALQLVERGDLRLEQEVASVLPEFGALQVLDGFDGDTPRLRAPRSQATIRQLLTHSSGLGYFFLNADLVRYLEATGLPDTLSGERRALLGQPLSSDPGTRWEYSVSVDWLGLVVEAVSGQALDAYLAEHVLGPLGMTDTTFAPSPEQLERMMAVHARTPDGGLVATPVGFPAAPEYWPGGHGLCGTAADYGRYLSALVGDGGPILRPETLQLMLSDQLAGAPQPASLTSTRPDLSNDVPFPEFPTTWGAGLKLTLVDLPGMRRAGTGDWAGLFNLYYWVDRTSGLAGLLATSVLPFFDLPIVETAVAVEQAGYAALTPA